LFLFKPRTRFLIGCSVLVLLTTLLLISSYSSTFSETYKEGTVLGRTAIAPADITTVDLAETERRRDAAREATRPIFNFDSSRAEISAQSLRASWEELKKQVAAGDTKPRLGSGENG